MMDLRKGRSALVGLVGLVMAAGTLTGCIGQGEYDRLYEQNRSLEARNAELARERDEARAALDLLRGRVGSGEGALSDLQRENNELRRQLDGALADLRSLEAQIGNLQFGRLDPETDEALRALAEQYPDLIKYDSARGMLRFASDLTFDSGSAVVKPGARDALNALASVLRSPSAAAYEVVIEGHTDSQRVSANTTRNHPTNRHLSAHRAISVIDALADMQVPRERMMAAGWGEFRPAVPNTPSGNTPQNRRVEIYLAKSRGNGVPAPAGTTGDAGMDQQGGRFNSGREQPPSRPQDITK